MTPIGTLILIIVVFVFIRQIAMLLSSGRKFTHRPAQSFPRGCRSCGGTNPGFASFCRQCGERL